MGIYMVSGCMWVFVSVWVLWGSGTEAGQWHDLLSRVRMAPGGRCLYRMYPPLAVRQFVLVVWTVHVHVASVGDCLCCWL